MRLVSLSTALLAAVLASSALAQESTREEFKEFCQAMQGRWVGEVTWVTDWPGFGKRGEKVTAYWEARLAEDGNAVIGRFFAGNGSSTSLICFDGGAKQIRWTDVDSGGTVGQSIVYKKEGKWRTKSEGSLADGTKTRFTSTATISEDGNTWTWEGSGTVGDKPAADRHDVWRRVSK